MSQIKSKTQAFVRPYSLTCHVLALLIAHSPSPSPPTPSLAGFVCIVQIVASSYAFVTLRSDGSLRGWGYDHLANQYFGGQAISVPSNLITVSSPVVQVARTDHAFAALKADGSVVAFGHAALGASGVPSFPVPVTSIFSTIRAFAAIL